MFPVGSQCFGESVKNPLHPLESLSGSVGMVAICTKRKVAVAPAKHTKAFNWPKKQIHTAHNYNLKKLKPQTSTKSVFIALFRGAITDLRSD